MEVTNDNKEYVSPWEQPIVKSIIQIFNGNVTKIVSLNEVNMSTNSDESDRWR